MRLPRLALASILLASILVVAGCSSHHTPPARSPVVRMYVDAIDKPSADFLLAWRDYQENGCALGSKEPVCQTNLVDMQTAATAIRVVLPDSSTPPPDIASLVSDTAEAADAVDTDIDHVSGSTAPGLTSAAQKLADDLARWQRVRA